MAVPARLKLFPVLAIALTLNLILGHE